MPRTNRSATMDLLVSWLTDLSDGCLTACPAASSCADVEVVDSDTHRTWPLKLAVREFSTSEREGKNFRMREAVLRSAPDGIVVLLYLNEEDDRRRGYPLKAAWVLSFRDFLSLPIALSSNGAYQCRPLPAPADSDDWSAYRCFTEGDLVRRVASICRARQPPAGRSSDATS